MFSFQDRFPDWKDFPIGLRVLVVDEDEEVSASVRTQLESFQYAVTTVGSSEEAFRVLGHKEQAFHVALVEAMTGGGQDGLKILEKASKTLPVLLMSSTDNMGLMMQGIAMGAADFLQKPLTDEKLRNIWQPVLRQAIAGGDISRLPKPAAIIHGSGGGTLAAKESSPSPLSPGGVSRARDGAVPFCEAAEREGKREGQGSEGSHRGLAHAAKLQRVEETSAVQDTVGRGEGFLGAGCGGGSEAGLSGTPASPPTPDQLLQQPATTTAGVTEPGEDCCSSGAVLLKVAETVGEALPDSYQGLETPLLAAPECGDSRQADGEDAHCEGHAKLILDDASCIQNKGWGTSLPQATGKEDVPAGLGGPVTASTEECASSLGFRQSSFGLGLEHLAKVDLDDLGYEPGVVLDDDDAPRVDLILLPDGSLDVGPINGLDVGEVHDTELSEEDAASMFLEVMRADEAKDEGEDGGMGLCGDVGPSSGDESNNEDNKARGEMGLEQCGMDKDCSEDVATDKSSKAAAGRRKVKVDWTPELHRRFVEVVEQLGVDKAIPSRILELMGVQCLTRHNIASHLQKYRSHRRHVMAREALDGGSWGKRPGDLSPWGRVRRDGVTWAAGTHGTHPPPIQPRTPMGLTPIQPHPVIAPRPPTMGHAPMHPMGPPPLHVWGHPTHDHSASHMWQQPAHPHPPPPPPMMAPAHAMWHAPDGGMWQYPAAQSHADTWGHPASAPAPGTPCYPPPPMMRMPMGGVPPAMGVPPGSMPPPPGTAPGAPMMPPLMGGPPPGAMGVGMAMGMGMGMVGGGTGGGAVMGSMGATGASGGQPAVMGALSPPSFFVDDVIHLPLYSGPDDDDSVGAKCSEFHPPKELLEAAISEALSNPWTPLPLGLKPPSMEGVMAELQRRDAVTSDGLWKV